MLYVAVPVTAEGRIVAVARAAVPMHAVDATVGQLVQTLVVALALGALMVVALAFWLAGTTAAPLLQLAAQVRALEAGRAASFVEPGGIGEVADLSRAFKQMAGRLQASFEAVSAERNRLSAVLETMADGLVIVDTNGRVLQINTAAERLLATSAASAVGAPLTGVCHELELAQQLNASDQQPRVIEVGLPRRQVRVAVSLIPGPDRQRLLLLQDVTELRRLEIVRRDFVANVSHELRTPIAAIKALVETLEDGAYEDPEVASDFLNRVHAETDLLAELVRELAELSRIESGQIDLRLETTTVDDLVQPTVKRFQPLAQRAGLELTYEPAEDLPAVVADRERIGQVLSNLLHNAIKFTPRGGVVVRSARHGSDVAISVVDSGLGIPTDDLARVFERFYKTDRSRSSGGTGLGLAIARHLVEAHRGRIWAEHNSGEGTAFTFTLPMADGAG
jgi:two-component system phosphate regulon sensor histidine kinase PhoR